MTHYIAIVEDAGPNKAVGIWFPDLPGCFSAGDDVDEALGNAVDAILLYAQALTAQGKPVPAPRSFSSLKNDPSIEAALRDHVVALVPFENGHVEAAE